MIYLNLSGDYSKETVGILRQPVNPGFFGRDAKAMEGDVNLFMEQWQVNDKDPQLYRTRQFPRLVSLCKSTSLDIGDPNNQGSAATK